MAEPSSSWDKPGDRVAVDDDEVLQIIERASTCVFVRSRRDGHPMGVVVGFGVLDGEVYTVTNVHRAAYRSLLRDPRCSAVFDVPGVASVTLVGRGEIVDDRATLDAFYASRPTSSMVTSGRLTQEQWLRLAYTENRRLVRIIPEKVISADLRKLPDS